MEPEKEEATQHKRYRRIEFVVGMLTAVLFVSLYWLADLYPHHPGSPAGWVTLALLGVPLYVLVEKLGSRIFNPDGSSGRRSIVLRFIYVVSVLLGLTAAGTIVSFFLASERWVVFPVRIVRGDSFILAVCRKEIRRMRSIIVVLITILSCGTVRSQLQRYPVEDFYHRNIAVPVNHFDSSEGTFSLYYELSTNFKFDKPTIFFIADQQQSYGKPGKVDRLAELYRFDSTFNLAFIENRGRRYSYIDVMNSDGTVDWEKVYRLLSSKQMIEDIECVREDLFKDHPESRLFIFARSGGGYVAQEYLAKYGNHVQRAYLQCAPNPIIMKQLGFLESKSFMKKLTEAGPGLPGKLAAILKTNIVPRLNLLWMLYRIEFAPGQPDSIYRRIINDLARNDTSSYHEYLKNGFDYSKVKGMQSAMTKQMGFGMGMSPIQCDGYYILGNPPHYIDPTYECLRDLCAPLVRLVEEKKVPPPEPPPLEEFRNIDTEVFFQAGLYDHMTPYQVGIELGKYFRHYELFIAEDNHMMKEHEKCYPQLRNAFFKYGIGSEELKKACASVNCKEWKFE